MVKIKSIWNHHPDTILSIEHKHTLFSATKGSMVLDDTRVSSSRDQHAQLVSLGVEGLKKKSPKCWLRKKGWLYTLPETKIAPENRPSQKETSIPTIHFQVPC